MSAQAKGGEGLPRLYITKERPGVIRIEGTDPLTGILAGMRAPEIVRRCNAHDALVEALKDCIYEIRSNKHFAGSVELEPSSNTKRILKNAVAAIKSSRSQA